MKVAAWLGLCLPLAGTCQAADVLAQLPWTRAPQGMLLVPPDSGRPAASVRADARSGGVWALAKIARPVVTTATWAVSGEVRYEGVEGQGYLEMWSFFPDGGHYFSRTLGTVGPMAPLTGSSGWRRFCLPFFNRAGTAPPASLEVNLVLPGKGRVDIGTLRLSQYAAGEDPLADASGAWWSDRHAAWLGAVGGSLVGLLGALVGWLGSRGKAPALVLPSTAVLAAVGGLALVAGLSALALGQPYGVWYPLLLGGGILGVVMGASYFGLRARYHALELRRIQAKDAR